MVNENRCIKVDLEFRCSVCGITEKAFNVYSVGGSYKISDMFLINLIPHGWTFDKDFCLYCEKGKIHWVTK